MKKMGMINDTQTLTISAAGFHSFSVSARDNLELELSITEGNSAVIYLFYKESQGKIKLRIKALKNSQTSILSWNDSADTLEVDEEVYVEEHATVNLAYSELGEGKVVRKTSYHLHAQYTALNSCLAIIANKHKRFLVQALHEEMDSRSDIKTYAIVQEDARFYLDVSGKINKGSHRSDATQTNRILTLSDRHEATVLPQLLIDDNDVMASHAMTMGQLDENQLYYMESRGIARNTAVQLITMGYLTPIAYLFEDKYRDEILRMIEEKVKTSCLI